MTYRDNESGLLEADLYAHNVAIENAMLTHEVRTLRAELDAKRSLDARTRIEADWIWIATVCGVSVVEFLVCWWWLG